MKQPMSWQRVSLESMDVVASYYDDTLWESLCHQEDHLISQIFNSRDNNKSGSTTLRAGRVMSVHFVSSNFTLCLPDIDCLCMFLLVFDVHHPKQTLFSTGSQSCDVRWK